MGVMWWETEVLQWMIGVVSKHITTACQNGGRLRCYVVDRCTTACPIPRRIFTGFDVVAFFTY